MVPVNVNRQEAIFPLVRQRQHAHGDGRERRGRLPAFKTLLACVLIECGWRSCG